jgi:TonB family protein
MEKEKFEMTVKSEQRLTGWMVVAAVMCLIGLPAMLMAETVSIPTATAMARVAKRVAPVYPAAARQLNVSGSQDVEITVDEQGSVVEAKVLKGNAMFSTASVSAVKQWKFTPLVQDGAAKSFTSVIVFNYTK